MVRLTLETPVRASDGEVVGEVGDVIVDPVGARLTHLVVKPHRGRESRLVPLALARIEDARSIELSVSADDVRRLPNVETFAYVRFDEEPAEDADSDVGATDLLAVTATESPAVVDGIGAFEQGIGMIYDRIPKGEVELRRSSDVVTVDGRRAGVIRALVIGGDGGISDLVVEHGHLWWRRETTLPIANVTAIESDAVTLRLSKQQVDRLPTRRL